MQHYGLPPLQGGTPHGQPPRQPEGAPLHPRLHALQQHQAMQRQTLVQQQQAQIDQMKASPACMDSTSDIRVWQAHWQAQGNNPQQMQVVQQQMLMQQQQMAQQQQLQTQQLVQQLQLQAQHLQAQQQMQMQMQMQTQMQTQQHILSPQTAPQVRGPGSSNAFGPDGMPLLPVPLGHKTAPTEASLPLPILKIYPLIPPHCVMCSTSSW